MNSRFPDNPWEEEYLDIHARGGYQKYQRGDPHGYPHQHGRYPGDDRGLRYGSNDSLDGFYRMLDSSNDISTGRSNRQVPSHIPRSMYGTRRQLYGQPIGGKIDRQLHGQPKGGERVRQLYGQPIGEERVPYKVHPTHEPVNHHRQNGPQRNDRHYGHHQVATFRPPESYATAVFEKPATAKKSRGKKGLKKGLNAVDTGMDVAETAMDVGEFFTGLFE